MSHCRIDHITITSPSLQAGSDFVFERLGEGQGRVVNTRAWEHTTCSCG